MYVTEIFVGILSSPQRNKHFDFSTYCHDGKRNCNLGISYYSGADRSLVPIFDSRRRGALGYIRNRKTEVKNHPKPQNREKIRPKPKTAYKTVKNRYSGDKWGIQSKLN